MALLKLIYLATKNIEKKWTPSLQNWGLIIQQLYIKFEDRGHCPVKCVSLKYRGFSFFKVEPFFQI